MLKERKIIPVTVGGGTGSPVIHQALHEINQIGGIDAITAVYDSGGATGRRRAEARIKGKAEIAYSDAMRNLFSLVPPDEANKETFKRIKDKFTYRDENGKVWGQEVFNAHFDKEEGFSKIEQILKEKIEIKGRVLPSSTEPSNIVFSTTSGNIFEGEHLLDDLSTSEKEVVRDIALSPEVEAYKPAVEALTDADLIILSSGSFHGSLLVNFLPEGMKEALSESNAKMYLVTNLVSTRNETHEFTPQNFVDAIEKYTGRRPDGLIVPQITRNEFEERHPDIAKLYDMENAHFLGWDAKKLSQVEKKGVDIIPHKATAIVKDDKEDKPVLRHDPQKLSSALVDILPKK